MEKLQFAQKAWEIDFGRVEEGYMFEKVWAYGNTVGQTKQELLVEVEGCKNYLGEEITFLNIPIIRCKEKDKYYFEDEGDYFIQALGRMFLQIFEELKSKGSFRKLNLRENAIFYVQEMHYYFWEPEDSGWQERFLARKR